MSVLLEALTRANARKSSLAGMEGSTAKVDGEGVLMLLSGADIDPGDLAGYLDTAASIFLIEWACGESHDKVVQGALVEGLLMGMMIERTQAERVKHGYAKPPEPGIVETATTLWRLVWERLR